MIHGFNFFYRGCLLCGLAVCCFVSNSSQVSAEFALNFQSNPNAVSSIANVTCSDGGMAGGMGGMGGGGPGCGLDYFMQEVVNDNGVLYYHVILGEVNQDNFAMEFYIVMAAAAGGMAEE